MTSWLLAGVLLLVIVIRLYRDASGKRRREAAERAAEAETIGGILEEARRIPGTAAGVSTFAGRWHGERAQVTTIVDTLATRKLPALWLSVTITEPVNIAATFDMMMRPAGPTTFSRFDFLPHTLATPPGFPLEAVIRTDAPGTLLPFATIGAHLETFQNGRAKELLVTRNGLRFVWLLSEADRVRYGAFRQADFGGARLDPALLELLLGRLSALRAALNADAVKAAA